MPKGYPGSLPVRPNPRVRIGVGVLIMIRRLTLVALSLAARLLMIAVALPCQAATIAQFDGGNSSTIIDAYPGMAGAGWAGAWQTATGNGGSFSLGPTVVATTPLSPGGGNYLTATVASTGSGSQGAVVRQYQTFGEVDLTKPHTIRFKYRPEDLANFTDGEDRFQAFAAPSVNHGTNDQSDWMILGQGGDWGGVPVAGKWVVYDGAKDGAPFSASSLINTGISVVAGRTYDFAVTVHPGAREWDVTVFDGINTYTRLNLGFRRSGTGVGPYLHFGGRANAAGESRPFSIDAVEITPASSAIRADFARGYGTVYADQLIGIAGRGWTGAWTGAGSGTSTVATTNPLDPTDPNYLTAVATAAGDRTLRRQYQSYGQVDTSAIHRISWKWRFDGDVAQLTSFADRIHFFADDEALSGTNAGNSWAIGYVAADQPGNDVHEGKWYFFNRTVDSGFNVQNMVSTGMDLVAGRIYNFEVWVYPQLGKYDATIADGFTSFSAKGLVFRNGSVGEYNYLHFGGARSAGATSWAFSLDSIMVSQVPEPSAWVLLAAAFPAIPAAWARRRRRLGG